jgi:hypothetical protein
MFISPYSSAYVEHLHFVLGSSAQLGSLLTVTVATIFPNSAQQRREFFVARSLTQWGSKVCANAREEAGIQLAIRGEARTRAGSTKRL